MAEDDIDAPLTAEEILRFGPVVEAQVWTTTFLAERRAPIAQAAGRPKFGPIFNSDGVGKAVLIRPCVSRGKRIRGLPPIYTPKMLEGHGGVFAGWPMYLDHMPAKLAEARKGRSVKEMAGQVLTPWWDADFVQEYDDEFGYQRGGTLSEIWATPYLRGLVGENPNLLHTSIAAWPTSGKPGKVPWNANVRGMTIEGIRRQPQGSVDFVPRGGAGGRLLLAEGESTDPDLTPWPEPQWTEEAERLVVSLAERLYAAPQMTPTTPPDFASMTPEAFRAYVQEHAPNFSALLSEGSPAPSAPAAPATATPALTSDDVQRMIREATEGAPTREEFEQTLEDTLGERELQRDLSRVAHEMISEAEGLPASWKSDLKGRYAMRPEGPAPALLVEAEVGDGGAELSEHDVLRRNVTADLERARDLIAEAQGKPRVKGEGGGTAKAGGVETKKGKLKEGEQADVPYWRKAFADSGVVESADDALSIHGVEKTEG